MICSKTSITIVVVVLCLFIATAGERRAAGQAPLPPVNSTGPEVAPVPAVTR